MASRSNQGVIKVVMSRSTTFAVHVSKFHLQCELDTKIHQFTFIYKYLLRYVHVCLQFLTFLTIFTILTILKNFNITFIVFIVITHKHISLQFTLLPKLQNVQILMSLNVSFM